MLRQVKEYNRNIPVVMITGNGTKERAVEALRLGAHDFIEKPFLPTQLVARVNDLLHTAEHSQGDNHFDDRAQPKASGSGA